MAKARITERSLTALKPDAPIWDTEVQGLAARRRVEGGDVTFFFKYRSPIERDASGRGVQRIITIGRWARGDWGIDTARKEATGYRDQLRLGRDPAAERDRAAEAMTVSDLCDAYIAAVPTLLLRGAGRAKKASTVATDRSRIEAHIKPLLGRRPADKVTNADVEAFLHQVAAGISARVAKEATGNPVKGGKGAASRTVGLLGAIFSYAIKLGIRADNPVKGVVRYADAKKDRRLSNNEYRLLETGLVRAVEAGISPVGIAAIRLLLLTGWRLSEATTLRWAEVDAARRTARLGDSKTGFSVRPLSREALAVIQAQPVIASNPHVFTATVEGKPLAGLPRQWDRIRKLAGLPADITIHTFRHSFASIAGDLGYSEIAIAGLVGHKKTSITSRYVHAADAVLLQAADMVARQIVALMEGRTAQEADVIMLPR